MKECHTAAVHLFGVCNSNEKPARVLACSMQLKGGGGGGGCYLIANKLLTFAFHTGLYTTLHIDELTEADEQLLRG